MFADDAKVVGVARNVCDCIMIQIALVILYND